MPLKRNYLQAKRPLPPLPTRPSLPVQRMYTPQQKLEEIIRNCDNAIYNTYGCFPKPNWM